MAYRNITIQVVGIALFFVGIVTAHTFASSFPFGNPLTYATLGFWSGLVLIALGIALAVATLFTSQQKREVEIKAQ